MSWMELREKRRGDWMRDCGERRGNQKIMEGTKNDYYKNIDELTFLLI